ncbi:MAG: 16S rRNA (guanine(527)-N(7))-methyltransferase RsmG [Pseudomonadota bacterium]
MTGPERFQAAFGVSRETLERLETYAALLEKWSQTINLVSKASLADLWWRHFSDSAQILTLANASARSWIDLGSGGGFPGLVVAILAAELRPGLSVTLIDSDLRKCAFLREVARKTGVHCQTETSRIEDRSAGMFDVISARALAPLPKLLALAHPFMGPTSQCLFLKGADHETELTEAAKSWHSEVRAIPSLTHPTASILCIEGVQRAS